MKISKRISLLALALLMFIPNMSVLAAPVADAATSFHGNVMVMEDNVSVIDLLDIQVEFETFDFSFDVSLCQGLAEPFASELLIDEYVDTFAQQQNIQNIEFLQTQILDMDLESIGFIGLEDAIISDLEELKNDNIILESFQLMLPNMSRLGSPQFYGSLNGYHFMVAFAVFNAQPVVWRDSNTQNLISWSLGLVDLAMGFAPAWASIPWTVFRAGERPQQGASVYNRTSQEITNKYIMIQDRDGRLSNNRTTFITLLRQQASVATFRTTYIPHSPHWPSSTHDTPAMTGAANNFFNQQANMQHVLSIYLSTNYWGVRNLFAPNPQVRWQ